MRPGGCVTRGEGLSHPRPSLDEPRRGINPLRRGLFCGYKTPLELVMGDYDFQHQREWLLQIGQRLRFDYADIIAAGPLPARLADLLKQLEDAPDGPATPD